jgi:hypothetical protein
MSSFSQRIVSNVAFPLSKTNNILSYNTQGSSAPVNHALSYVEVEMALSGLGDQGLQNVTFGRNGNYYSPSCMIRNSSLVESTGKVHQQLQFVNVLNQSLQYYNQGSQTVVSSSVISSGSGHRDPTTDTVKSTFNKTYKDENDSIFVHIPMSEVLPGDIGSSDVYPLTNDSTYNLLLEPQYRFLQRSIPEGVYGISETSLTIGVDFGGITGSDVNVPALAVGTVGNYSIGDSVYVLCTVSGSEVLVAKNIVNVVADVLPSTPGRLVLNSPVSTNNATAVTVSRYSNTNLLSCAPQATQSSTFTLMTPEPKATSDLSVGTVCKVHISVSQGFESNNPLKAVINRKITALSAGTNITTVTVAPITLADLGLVDPLGYYFVNIFIEPLYQNLDTVEWQVVNSHLVLFHTNINTKTPKKMIVSSWESTNVQMLENTPLFRYNFQIRNSTFNAYVMLNDGDTLFSQAMGIDSYILANNEVPLSSVYLPIDSSLHQDMVIRVLDNSPNYKPNNLKSKKNDEVVENTEVCMMLGKIYRSVIDGEYVMPSDLSVNNNLRVELVPSSLTQQCNVFLFSEKFTQL